MSRTLRSGRAVANKAAFWGKWGAYDPKHAETFLKQAYNRGYGQPILTGRYVEYEDSTTLLTFFARRWRYDWLKHIAMRVDAQRTPLVVLRRVRCYCFNNILFCGFVKEMFRFWLMGETRVHFYLFVLIDYGCICYLII